MKKRFWTLVVAAGVLSAWVLRPLTAAESPVYVYTYEGKTNVTRQGKTSDLRLDMPARAGDHFKIEPDGWIDYVFFYSAGVRVTGPGEVTLKSVSSPSGLEMSISSGTALIRSENAGESLNLVLHTPLAALTVTDPVLAQVIVEAADKKGQGGRTAVYVKKGRIDVLAKPSDSSVRLIENQKVEITADTYIPSAKGTMEEEIKPVEKARTVYVPKKEDESDF